MNSKDEIIDRFNGLRDLNNRIIKCIGNTNDKLLEDPIRILRAIRLSIIYDFKLDNDIIDFIKNNKILIKKISYYRKKEELDKIFSSNNKLVGLKKLKELNLLEVLELNYSEVKFTNDINGIYAQINICDKYSFSKETKKIISNIKEIIKLKEINNITLYKYGLYINSIAGEILGYNSAEINKMYKSLPIKTRKDIKITYKSIVKLNNNCYNSVNEIYRLLEENILNYSLRNKVKDIVKFIRK